MMYFPILNEELFRTPEFSKSQGRNDGLKIKAKTCYGELCLGFKQENWNIPCGGWPWWLDPFSSANKNKKVVFKFDKPQSSSHTLWGM